MSMCVGIPMDVLKILLYIANTQRQLTQTMIVGCVIKYLLQIAEKVLRPID